jgi:ribosomal-protein-alanine N-acetyltransferase
MVRLRSATRADIDSLFDLDQLCFPPQIAYSRGEFRSLLNSPRAVSTIAEDEQILAGFAVAQTVRARGSFVGHIVTIDVAPAFRRRGIGHLLMESLESTLRSAGAERLRLEVAVNNSPALRFYDGLGFVCIGQIRGYYHAELDALVMEKMLSVRPTFIR